MTSYIISSTEPEFIVKGLGGNTSTVPERYGADVIWIEPKIGGMVGVQRKEFNDLLSSLADGRLAKELAQLQQCKLAILIIEGKMRWSADGRVLIHRYFKVLRSQFRSQIRSIQMRGIVVEFSDSMEDTVNLVEEIAAWASKERHDSLDRRPKAANNNWGSSSSESWLQFFLQGIPGVGPKMALDIIKYFGGTLPLTWTVKPDEFLKIKGVGKKTLESLESAVKFLER